MNKIYILIVILFMIPILSFTPIDDRYSILDENDFAMMKVDNESPALTIPDENFESFNEWICFNINDVEITKSEVDYNGWHYVPSINASVSNSIISFDLDPEEKWDVDLVINTWNDLFENQKSVCISGAYLQETDNNGELWYIQKIKTNNGYWDRSDSDQFILKDPEKED